MVSKLSSFALGLAGALAAGSLATAQPMQMPVPLHDYKAAPAGTYTLDPTHTGLIVKVPHLGFSYEVFRWQGVSGSLAWDPANPAADKLSVSVVASSITTAPVDKFGEELTNDKFLNAAKFPTMTFVATGFHPDSPTHGKITGDLTVMGVTRPVVFDADLVGVGKFFGKQVIGVSAKTMLDVKGLGLPPMLSAPVELDIDTEFHLPA